MNNELTQHISTLLKENDCVIIPGLGGFVVHYTPATLKGHDKNQTFLPPARIVGFNPQLRMNDGLLAQAYMMAHGINYTEAFARLRLDVDYLCEMLHKSGHVTIPNIGELCCSINGVYTFQPCSNQILTPAFYGLENFDMEVLPARKIDTTSFRKAIGKYPHNRRKYKNLIQIAAIAATLLLFFFLSAPVQNTEVSNGNYAQLMPEDLLRQVSHLSITATPVNLQALSSKDKKESFSEERKNIIGVMKEENVRNITSIPPVIIPQTDIRDKGMMSSSVAHSEKDTLKKLPIAKKKYHIIVASVTTESAAKDMAQELIKQGFIEAKVLIGDKRIRISIQSYASEQEAYHALNNFRKQEAYKSAWVLKK